MSFGSRLMIVAGFFLVVAVSTAIHRDLSDNSRIAPVALTQADAISDCGGPAELKESKEDSGDGVEVIVEFYECENGDRILARR